MRIALTTPPPTSLAAGAFPRPPAWLHALQPELTLNPLPVLGSPHPCVRTCVRHRNPTPGGWTPGALSRAQGIAWRGCRLGVTHGPTRPPVCPLRKPPAAGFLRVGAPARAQTHFLDLGAFECEVGVEEIRRWSRGMRFRARAPHDPLPSLPSRSTQGSRRRCPQSFFTSATPFTHTRAAAAARSIARGGTRFQ